MPRTRILGLALAHALLLAPSAQAGDVSIELDAGDGFSLKNDGGAIERLRVDEDTGNISRNGALFVHTTGTDNTFVGEGAGNTSTSSAENSAFGKNALMSNTSGYDNSAFGWSALSSNTTGHSNSALGARALQSNTLGFKNSAFGWFALRANTTGNLNSAFGHSSLRYNSTGTRNSAFGNSTLGSNTSGYENSAFGSGGLSANTAGSRNSAFGVAALSYNSTGNDNAAFGRDSLRYNTTGESNSAFGMDALRANTEGTNNTALGHDALASNTTGSRNIGVGDGAGSSQTTGDDNIYIANQGVAGESDQIKIGTVGTHTQATMAGIFGNTSAAGLTVRVNALGILGTTTSSIRFKQGVRDMGEASDALLRLRPVVFHYREEAVGEESAQVLQYGLIAEEVAEVAPELVALDAEGRPYSVHYEVLAPMLLNEVQEQQRTIERQRTRLEIEAEHNQAQEATILTLLSRLETLESRLSTEPMETDR